MSVLRSLPPPPEPIFRLSVKQYHELIDHGILTSDDHVELLEGILVCKMPKNPPLETATGLITDILTPVLPRGWHLRTQATITLSDSEPEPDGAVVRGKRSDYQSQHPKAADLALVIEVADSTLSSDRNAKLRMYARAGIICYWIINLIDRQIEVYTLPDAAAVVPTYGSTEIFKPGQTVPLSLNYQSIAQIAVDELLPTAA